ncbi:Lon-like ATP-dependent protease [Gammaproteobacteria bacterium]
MKTVKPLVPSQLRRICDLKKLKFKSTNDLPNIKKIICQDRAVHALTFGLEIKNHGFNIYALGPTGTGKTTVVLKYLEKEAKTKPTPPDWLYINNFESGDKPKKMQLLAGKGHEFRDDIDQLVLALKTEVPKAFEAESYEHEHAAIEKKFRTHTEELFQQLAKKTDARGFQLTQSQQGFTVLPVFNGKTLTAEELAKLEEKDRKKIKLNEETIINELHESMKKFEHSQKEVQKKMLELDQRVVSFSINHMIATLKEKYNQHKNIINFLSQIREHLLKNVQTFKCIKQAENIPMQERFLMLNESEPTFEEYRVNLIVDNSKSVGAPVIFEKNPIGPNLVGRIEQQGRFGTLVTNFRMIKGGALHRANGGYLVLDILDLLKKPLSWEILKRALKSKEIVVESMIETLGAFITKTLEPEPIPLNIKVILLGDPTLYYMINELDSEFKELFKVKVDFASHMNWNDKTPYQYAEFIGMICREENLKHFTPAGVAKIVEYGARLVEHQKRITIKFGDIADITRQACYWAAKNTNKLVGAKDVQKALIEKVYRSNHLEEIISEMIAEKTIKISTKNKAIGQINGLSVLTLGDYQFGKPSRITARTYVGNAGIINIEREIELGGHIHNKGSLIIAGYFGGKYAQHAPIAFSASITFEQVYEEVDGDSASAAEIYALLSSISGYPLRQDLAITGSVNQHGEIQAIGGINEKIEGFYHVCKIFGLTGKQGVIMPENNIKNLMLHEEVIEAVKKGKFHIYAIATIDEGIPLLTGKPAGLRLPDGSYQKNTVNWVVEQHIIELAKKFKTFGIEKTKQEKNRNIKK